MNKAIVAWSGGKDSCQAMVQAFNIKLLPVVLLNVLNEDGVISRAHGIPKHILQAQSDALHMDLFCIASSWKDYENNFLKALVTLKNTYQATHVIFGDIDLKEHRIWNENICSKAGLKAVFPLWNQNRKKLVLQMINDGMKAMIVSCNELMGKEYIGKIINEALVQDLVSKGIDPCGEEGEFHTLVLDCKLYKAPVSAVVNSIKQHEQMWLADLDVLSE